LVLCVQDFDAVTIGAKPETANFQFNMNYLRCIIADGAGLMVGIILAQVDLSALVGYRHENCTTVSDTSPGVVQRTVATHTATITEVPNIIGDRVHRATHKAVLATSSPGRKLLAGGIHRSRYTG